MTSLYSKIETAKNGTLIPVFASGKTMESRYNPQRDAQTLFDSIKSNAGFFLVTGIGSGIFINLLSKNFPHAKIIALENSEKDLLFLKQLDTVKELHNNPNIVFSTFENLFDSIINNYLPAKYGDFKIIEQKAWLSENIQNTNKISQTISQALGIISADYSVQAHFGKIWQKNILENAALVEKNNYSFAKLSEELISKTAVITAAGPSLDLFINNLNTKELNKYYFISTDTACSALYKHNIEAEICVSIDGQTVSYNHFLYNHKDSKTVFFFDLCANSSAAKNLINKQMKVCFFTSGHPLSSAINIFGNSFLPQLFSGSGTVTITALDLAVKLGFKNILIAGADFSYLNGMPYTSGTYLEGLYNKASCKIKNSETLYDALMYRMPLTVISKNKKTNQILDAYKASLEKYLYSCGIEFSSENGIYYLHVNNKNKGNLFKENHSFSLKDFFQKLKTSSLYESEILLLPYIAWLRKNEKYKNCAYEELLQLAFNSIVSYNI